MGLSCTKLPKSKTDFVNRVFSKTTPRGEGVAAVVGRQSSVFGKSQKLAKWGQAGIRRDLDGIFPRNLLIR
jgi:hypothetical protein